MQRGISRGKISGYLYFRPQKGLLILILSNQAAIALFAVEHERKMYFDCFANGIKLALMLFFLENKQSYTTLFVKAFVCE